MIVTCKGWTLVYAVLKCTVPDPPQTTVVACPRLVDWSKTDEQAAGAALAQLPPGHPLRRMGVVAIKQRDLVRACKVAR
jgi:hypothetical protein